MKKQRTILLVCLSCIVALAVWGAVLEPGSTVRVLPASTLDSDGDSLEDALERQVRTDPQLKDTDKDGQHGLAWTIVYGS